jgi:hypothetical protein
MMQARWVHSRPERVAGARGRTRRLNRPRCLETAAAICIVPFRTHMRRRPHCPTLSVPLRAAVGEAYRLAQTPRQRRRRSVKTKSPAPPKARPRIRRAARLRSKLGQAIEFCSRHQLEIFSRLRWRKCAPGNSRDEGKQIPGGGNSWGSGEPLFIRQIVLDGHRLPYDALDATDVETAENKPAKPR